MQHLHVRRTWNLYLWYSSSSFSNQLYSSFSKLSLSFKYLCSISIQILPSFSLSIYFAESSLLV